MLLLYELKWCFANMGDISPSLNSNQIILVNLVMWQMTDWSAVTPHVGIEHTWHRTGKHLHMYMPCLQTQMTSPLVMRLPTCVLSC